MFLTSRLQHCPIKQIILAVGDQTALQNGLGRRWCVGVLRSIQVHCFSWRVFHCIWNTIIWNIWLIWFTWWFREHVTFGLKWWVRGYEWTLDYGNVTTRGKARFIHKGLRTSGRSFILKFYHIKIRGPYRFPAIDHVPLSQWRWTDAFRRTLEQAVRVWQPNCPLAFLKNHFCWTVPSPGFLSAGFAPFHPIHH